jgi:hypothetical protein
MQRISIFILCLFTASLPVQAQDVNPYLLADQAGNFFVCLIGGILLAIAFQFLLTNLGLAIGISAVGNVRDQANSNTSDSNHDAGNSDSSSAPLGVKITSGLGIFLTLSMSVALFFASLISVKLSLIPTNWVGFALGLIIWAGFLILTLWMESRMISGLFGAVFSVAKGALATGADAVGTVFGSGNDRQSPEKTARSTVEAIHDEIRQEFDQGQFEQKLNEYVDKLAPKGLNIDELHNRLADLLNDIEVREQDAPDDPAATKKLFLEIAGEQKGLSAKDKENLSNAFDQAKSAVSEGDSKKEKLTKAVDKLSPGSEEQGREYRRKIEEYLKNSDQEALQPDQLEKDLERILDDPQATPEVLRARISQIDRSTIKALLANQGMGSDRAEQYLSKAERVINKIRSRVGEVKHQAHNAAEDQRVSTQQRATGQQKDTEMKIREWFNRMDRPELKYERLKLDGQRMLDDPKAAPRILKKRLQKLDRDSLVTLVSNNSKIERSQVEQTVANLEEARDTVIRKTEEIEQEIRRRLEQAKQEGLKQAEATRKTAASAAWWLFIAALISGGASTLGGILALSL